jgi:hypothetical protein
LGPDHEDLDNAERLTAADAPLRELIKKWRAVDALGNTYLRTGFMCADELEALVMPAPSEEKP